MVLVEAGHRVNWEGRSGREIQHAGPAERSAKFVLFIVLAFFCDCHEIVEMVTGLFTCILAAHFRGKVSKLVYAGFWPRRLR